MVLEHLDTGSCEKIISNCCIQNLKQVLIHTSGVFLISTGNKIMSELKEITIEAIVRSWPLRTQPCSGRKGEPFTMGIHRICTQHKNKLFYTK